LTKLVPALTTTVVVIAVITGCSSPRLCPAVAYYDGIGVTFASGLAPPSDAISVSACIDRDCSSLGQTSLGQLGSRETELPLSQVNGSAKVRVSVQITDLASSRSVFAASVLVTPRKDQPNPGCNPGRWVTHVTATADGALQTS
jgi:hypothetical protein